ncbi:MAG TPA: 2Fe-2S iron-sulfur cluster-binding protein [Anaerolineaceae bacterium]|nr:2Fe-2S iron-sulfur cluster-binding protein [Anaerolineaceae bacterium]
MNNKWQITFKISRQKGNEPRKFEKFKIEVDPDEYVLDGIERIWAFHDNSLVFRHACHHSTCGACGMLVNGVEKLTCITTIRSVTRNGGTLTIEPLRNFPVVSDLSVDMGTFYQRMEQANFNQVTTLEEGCLPFEKKKLVPHGEEQSPRLVDCIECGLCISACPAGLTSDSYLGPAVMSAIRDGYAHNCDFSLMQLVDHQDGVWRCHSAYECSAVCPSMVDPGWRIMDMRKKIIAYRFSHLFKATTPKRSKP